MAWEKMQLLVKEFDKEVAWHGIAERCEEKDTYLISDILVYPQEVTGSTVTTDQSKYENWLMSHDDEVFNNIRMQGHSHVNMAVSPSSVDLSLYERILDQLSSDMFYIFMIWNKRGEKTVKIYDLRENILFETADVTVTIKGMEDMTEFLEEAKELVVTKTYNYGGYGTGAHPYHYPGYGAAKEMSRKAVQAWENISPLCQQVRKAKGARGNVRKTNQLENR